MTAAVTAAALLLQLVLVIHGGRVLDEIEPPGLGLRLARFVSYFTIQSNVLVLLGTALLARRPDRDEPWFRALRLAGVVGITVTGVVHFLLLRPLLDLSGWDWVADKLLHMAVPALAVVGWALFGPRPRTDAAAIARAFVWPLLWLGWTLAVGAVSGWFPYPFLDFETEGWGHVLLASGGVTVLAALLFALVAYADRRLPPAPAA